MIDLFKLSTWDFAAFAFSNACFNASFAFSISDLFEDLFTNFLASLAEFNSLTNVE
ncbi:hypothetical protein VZ236_01355 [Metamycoplasma hominis]